LPIENAFPKAEGKEKLTKLKDYGKEEK